MKKAYLCLADGSIYEGVAFGDVKEQIGELVFTTGMSGYLETLTDPSYYGQIVLQTFPLIGNYGVIPEDFEGNTFVRGYVVRELCDTPSNFRSIGKLDDFLKEKGIPGIAGIDTRAITKKIRETGVMNAMISYTLPVDYNAIREYTIQNAIQAVSSASTVTMHAEKEEYHVVLLDYGAKRNIARELLSRNCKVTIVPGNTDAKTILSYNPDGIMLSNGPGDPSENTEEIKVIRELLGKKPIFGICLGHQLLALANGAKTFKMKYGHRGCNQPVKDLVTGRTFITTQNHGYAVEENSLQKGIVRFVNANDSTVEGITYPKIHSFSVQFHPEACAGPKDTSFLFDLFIKNMEETSHA